MISEIAGNDESIITRITFKKYNFIMHRNKPDDADIYMFRFVMHDWSDKYVIRILKNIVPNMKTDAHILIMDYLIGEPDKNLLVIERLERFVDACIQVTMTVALTSSILGQWTWLLCLSWQARRGQRMTGFS